MSELFRNLGVALSNSSETARVSIVCSTENIFQGWQPIFYKKWTWELYQVKRHFIDAFK